MLSEFSSQPGNQWRSPMSIAAYITWLAVCMPIFIEAWQEGSFANHWLGTAALVAMLALFAIRASDTQPVMVHAQVNALVQGGLVLLASANWREGSIAVLLILVVAQIVLLYPRRLAFFLVLSTNILMLGIWHFAWGVDWARALTSLGQIFGFQIFAAMTAIYAHESERGREQLSVLNAELLATQSLLSESTRNDERLRLSRELHDVAGHKLTALKLTLRALQRQDQSANADLELCLRLSDELLQDIRAVVSTLRVHDGVDLADSLRAIARPFPGVTIRLNGMEHARTASMAQAGALLRFAQEALTNAIRHGQARLIQITGEVTETGLRLHIQDDGKGRLPVREGNGILGMRERLAPLGGQIQLTENPGRGLQITASVPGSDPSARPITEIHHEPTRLTQHSSSARG